MFLLGMKNARITSSFPVLRSPFPTVLWAGFSNYYRIVQRTAASRFLPNALNTVVQL
jgi:hypothetical protein